MVQLKGAKSKVVTTAVDKTADGISKIGKYIKSNVKNAVDQCNPTKKLSNAKEFIQDIHSEAYELLTASESTTVDVDKTKKLTFHKTIAEMIQDKSVVKAIQILVENQNLIFHRKI